MPEIRKPYDRERVPFTSNKPSLARQSFKDECDINQVMRRFEKTGMLTHLNEHNGNYGDFIGVQDYHSAVNQVMAAQAAFDTLPSAVRKRFENNPAEFLAFVENPENADKMVEMGLAHAPYVKANPADPDPAPKSTQDAPKAEIPPDPA